MNHNGLTRRQFFFLSTAAGLAAIPRRARAQTSANEKLNIAGIAAGGRGRGHMHRASEEHNVVALCDVDDARAAEVYDKLPNVPRYRDFRVMLDKEHKNIDAVVVATPDHTHAVAAMAAMELGKHVYVEKPLTHSIFEARKLLKAARRYKVVTQMGNQGHSGDGARQLCEMVWAGAIGEVREVHIWTDRPGGYWTQGMTKPLPEEPVPATLDWDLWVGPAPMRPYNHGYVPHDWRGWWDFGCGALGDMGCHIMDGPFWSLDLSEPESVECIRLEGKNDQTGPTKCITKYEFPARHNKFANKQMSPVDVYWYEGGLQPERPEGIPEGERLGDGDNNGSLFIGETGMLTTGCYASGTRLVPKARMESYERPPETIPRVPNNGDHRLDWYTACIENGRAGSDFEYAVPLTETVLLGNLAQRTGEKIYWNSKKMRVTNNVPDAERYIKRKYRRGWRL